MVFTANSCQQQTWQNDYYSTYWPALWPLTTDVVFPHLAGMTTRLASPLLFSWNPGNWLALLWSPVILRHHVFRWDVWNLKCFQAWPSQGDNARTSSASMHGFLTKGQQRVQVHEWGKGQAFFENAADKKIGKYLKQAKQIESQNSPQQNYQRCAL